MKKYHINLIQKKTQNLADKLIYFFLHYLRYIIVLTQIVVIGVFFFRFQIDQEIIDLKESIEQKQEILKVTRSLVDDAANLSRKVEKAKQILASQDKFLQDKRTIFSIIPQEIILNKFIMEDKRVQVSGLSNSIAMIKSFSDKLKANRQFKTITIESVTKSSQGFEFAINISLD